MQIINFIKDFLVKSEDDRAKKANKNAFFMLIFRGVNILISFLYVPLLIKSLNSFHYGIWLTITSLLMWLNLFDIGLGNGLRNKLSQSLAQNSNSESKKLVSTAYAAIFGLSVLLVIIYFAISKFIDWTIVLNIPYSMKNEITKLINIVILFYMLQFSLSIINSIFYAFQKPANITFISTIGQLLSFLLVCFAVYILNAKSLLKLGLIISISPNIVLIVFTIIFFLKEGKNIAPNFKFIELKYLKSILDLGVKFFVLQIITIILFQTSNIIIAQNIGQVAVTEYNIAYKYIGLIYFVFSILVTPYWSATTDAYTRQDLDWIKKSEKKLNKIWLFLSFIGILMYLFSKIIYKMWIGTAVHANYLTLFLALIYFILLSKYIIYAFILNGMGKINIQLIITSIEAILFIPLTIFLSNKMQLNGVFLSLIFTGLINCLWSIIQYKKIINGTAKGLWEK